MLVQRLVYRAQLLTGHEDEGKRILNDTALPEDVLTLSVFRFHRNLFFYYECAAALRTPDELFPALNTHLETVPFAEEKRHYVRMNEVFHYNRPTENDPWRDKEQGQPFGRLNRLRPEMISSYIFYHNQLQEEKPGCGDKYGLIALNENLMFFYEERPYRIEKALYKGRLDTHNTPGGWGELMAQHFLPWEDTDAVWRDDLELVCFKRCQIIGKF